MELDKIITLIHTVSDSALTGFTLEEGNIRLVLEKIPKSAAAILPQEYQTVIRESVPYVHNTCAAPVVSAPAEAAVQEKVQETDGIKAAEGSNVSSQNMQVIKSPLVGTFYTAPSPEESEFVKVGDTVKKGQVLGIIEAMKLMNEIESEYDGVVEAILVQNEQIVEYGQELFLIR